MATTPITEPALDGLDYFMILLNTVIERGKIRAEEKKDDEKRLNGKEKTRLSIALHGPKMMSPFIKSTITMLRKFLPTFRHLLPPPTPRKMMSRPNIPRRMSNASQGSSQRGFGTGSDSDPDSDHSSRISHRIGPSSPVLGKNGGPDPSKPTLTTSPEPSTPPGGAEGSAAPSMLLPDDHHSAFYSSHSASASNARFRSSVQRLIRLRHLAETRGPGSEPGVDPRRDGKEYDHITADCHIDVIDYGTEKMEMQEYDNKGFLKFLDTSLRQKADWAKVRWINIKGIDWKIIKALTLVYRLHPLAIEDVIHSRDSRSKVDYYKDQLYIQGLSLMLRTKDDPEEAVVTLGSEEAQTETEEPIQGRPLSWLTSKMQSPNKDLQNLPPPYGSTARTTREPVRQDTWRFSPRRQKIHAAQMAVDKLRGEERVQVKRRNLYMFMFRDGTLITFHDAKDSIYDQAIKTRLQEENTMLRVTSDVSVLVQSILDLIVDHAIEVTEAFQAEILDLEQKTLLRPDMDSVKLLHVLSAEITLHKRSLKPLQSMVYGLRRYDLDRAVALAVSADPNANATNTKGYMSHQAKVYLADVHDHLEYVIASMEMFQTVTENLIGYSFNILSYDMNETMRRLTLATIIFFPLTFLTSYFGMNFTTMPSIDTSELYFWQLSAPCVLVLVLMFTWGDVTKMWSFGLAVQADLGD
ncbi:hypothetical protein FRB98_004051 [Tulasnella sp. 332]|nr:hypothetical protein FRB98_004051 [Tulasnella sp. 332]